VRFADRRDFSPVPKLLQEHGADPRALTQINARLAAAAARC
jgi:hypothetical protein